MVNRPVSMNCKRITGQQGKFTDRGNRSQKENLYFICTISLAKYSLMMFVKLVLKV